MLRRWANCLTSEGKTKILEELTLDKTIASGPDEISAFRGDAVPAPFEQLDDDRVVSGRSTTQSLYG